jgi:Kef-type K+ transport system membrane component KefB
MTASQTLTLLVLALGAFVAPLVSRRIGIPTAVGEILSGAVLATLIGRLTTTGIPGALGFVGFALLMFTAGGDIDFDRLERGGRRQVLLALGFVGISSTGTLAIASALDLPPILTITGSVMSIGVAIAALRETGHLDDRLGQTVLVVGGLGEFVSLLALTGLDLTATTHGTDRLLAAGRVLLALLVAYLLLVGLRSLVWWYPERFERLLEVKDPSEVGVRAAMATMLAFAAGASLLGMEPILGAFLAGGLFGFVFRAKEVLEEKLAAVGYGFLIPFFFLGVGQELRPAELLTPGVARLVGGVILLTLAGRLLASPLLRWAGLSWRESWSVACFLAAPLTLQVATVQLGADLGLLRPADVTGIVLAAVISGILLPSVGHQLVRIGQPAPAATPPRAPRADHPTPPRGSSADGEARTPGSG